MQIEWNSLLWDKGKHNAFTDLQLYKGSLFCAFREAQNHISQDGIIRIVACDTTGKRLFSSNIRLPNTDLRDPKLSVTPDGKLLLIAYAREYHLQDTIKQSKPIYCFSQDGKSWSSIKYFGHKFWWLWRVSWFNQRAYGLAYNRRSNAINLYAGDPRRTFEIIKPSILCQDVHGLGYPNESDIAFRQDGTALALVRRDADSCTAQLGIAKAPYTQWKWHDLAEYIGGPAIQLINDNTAIVAGRLWHKDGPKTALWLLDLTTFKLRLKLVLPSAGDNSYPGIQMCEEQVFVSYYSSHLEGKSNIFLTKIHLDIVE